MAKHFLIFICLLVVFISCSTDNRLLRKHKYAEVVNKTTFTISSDPDNRKASRMLQEAYSQALVYYQNEIDQILTSNDSFRWNQTLEIMQTVNSLSDEIGRIPTANQLIPSLKTYTLEMTDVQNRAAKEYYDAGMDALNQKTRTKAQLAFSYFQDADDLIHGYSDVQQKLMESKDFATLKVIVEQIPVNGQFEYSAQFFYNKVLKMLNQQFQAEDFVSFISQKEAEETKLKYPDLVLKMSFYDFSIGTLQHSELEKGLSTTIVESYQVKVKQDTSFYTIGEKGHERLELVMVPRGEMITRTRKVPKSGKIEIITDQVYSGGLLEVNAVEFQSQKVVFNDEIPSQYTWQNQYGTFEGDNEVLNNELRMILYREFVQPPESQDMFVLFTKPIFSQLTEKLTSYFRQNN